MKKEHTPATEFEKMLMWTSYRYCIGRKSYVVTMADEIALNFAYRLDHNERLSTAKDNSADVMKMGKFLICLRFDNVERLQLIDYALHFSFGF